MTVRNSLLMLSLLSALALVGCQQQGTTYSQVTPPTFKQAPITHPLPKFNAPQSPGYAANGPRDWTPAVSPKHWTWIIIHHSATPSGGARKFDADHRARGFDELGYDFVIGNGTETRNGQIEVGPRWRAQKVGAHTKDPSGLNRYNNAGIGICFVGNFDVTKPTPEQVQACAKLVAYLMKTYHIPSSRILGHRDCKSTDCPGKFFPLATLRRMATQQLAAEGITIPDDLADASPNTELMHAK